MPTIELPPRLLGLAVRNDDADGGSVSPTFRYPPIPDRRRLSEIDSRLLRGELRRLIDERCERSPPPLLFVAMGPTLGDCGTD